jgi:hypothetical protein
LKIAVHVGLHKTGTTSFQSACANARDALRTAGIEYPIFDSQSLNAGNHIRVAYVLRHEGARAALRLLTDVANSTADCHTMLISCEEFTNILGDPSLREITQDFIAGLAQEFEKVKYVCVIRESVAIIKSSFREYVEAVGLPFDGTEMLREHVRQHWVARKMIFEILNESLQVINYDELDRNRFCNDLLQKILNAPIVLEECRLNVSADKSAHTILGSQIRMLYYNSLRAASPYSEEVRAEYENVLAGITISPEIDQKLRTDFDRWISLSLSEVLAELRLTEGIAL